MDIFLQKLSHELELLENKVRKLGEACDSFVEYSLNHDIFGDSSDFLQKLYRVNGMVSELVEVLLDIEKRIAELKLGAPPLETLEKVKERAKEKRLRRLVKILRRITAPREVEVKLPTVEYGRKIMEKIDDLIWSYPCHLQLIREQDTAEDHKRRDLSLTEFRAYIVDLAADIKTFCTACINLKKKVTEEHLRIVYEAMIQSATTPITPPSRGGL